jgi:hypothetical protein
MSQRAVQPVGIAFGLAFCVLGVVLFRFAWGLLRSPESASRSVSDLLRRLGSEPRLVEWIEGNYRIAPLRVWLVVMLSAIGLCLVGIGIYVTAVSARGV